MKHSGETPASDGKVEKINELQSRADGQTQGGAEEGAENNVRSSGQNYDMQKIRDVVENASDIREEKVALLKKMIASGKYDVDARNVADKMIREFLLEEVLKT